jgi:hypothetical protein
VVPAHARHAAHTFRRVAGSCHRLGGFHGVLHEGKQKRRRPGVEHALDGDGVVPGHTHHGQHLGIADCLQQVHHFHHVQRRVLHVDHAPFETGIAHRLGHDRAGAHDPGAQRRLRATRSQELAEGIHDGLLQ